MCHTIDADDTRAHDGTRGMIAAATARQYLLVVPERNWFCQEKNRGLLGVPGIPEKVLTVSLDRRATCVYDWVRLLARQEKIVFFMMRLHNRIDILAQNSEHLWEECRRQL